MVGTDGPSCAPLLRSAQFSIADWRGPSQRLAALFSKTIKNRRKWAYLFGQERRKVGRLRRQAARCFLVTPEADSMELGTWCWPRVLPIRGIFLLARFPHGVCFPLALALGHDVPSALAMASRSGR